MELKFCPYCGSHLFENAKFCSQCGKEIPGKIPEEISQETKQQREVVEEEKKSKPRPVMQKDDPLRTIKIGKYSFQVPESVIVYNKIRSQFVDYAIQSQKVFETLYDQDVNSFETLYDKALPAVVVSATNAIRFTISELDKYGLAITPEEFLRLSQENLYLGDVLQEYVDTAKRLEEFVEQLKSYRAKNRSQGIQWQGGGFGLSGAIGGAVMAGALNLATDAVRGIGHAVVDSADRARLRKVQLDLYKARDHKSFLGKRLYTFCMDLFDTAVHLLEEKNLIVQPPLNTAAGISAITEAFDLVDGTKTPNQENIEKALKLTLQGMPHDPYFLLSYLTLYKIPCIDKEDLLTVVEYFGMESPFYEKIEEYEKPILGSFRTMPEDTIADIERKLARAEELKSKSCYATISFHQLKAKKEKFIKDSEDLLAKKMEEMSKQKESETRFAEIKELPEDNLEQMKSKRKALARISVTPDVEAEVMRLTRKIKEERSKSIDKTATIEADPERLLQKEINEYRNYARKIVLDVGNLLLEERYDLVWDMAEKGCAFAQDRLIHYYAPITLATIGKEKRMKREAAYANCLENGFLFAEDVKYWYIFQAEMKCGRYGDNISSVAMDAMKRIWALAQMGVISAMGQCGQWVTVDKQDVPLCDVNKGIEYIKLAAKAGSINALNLIAFLYSSGSFGFPKDPLLAKKYVNFRKAYEEIWEQEIYNRPLRRP